MNNRLVKAFGIKYMIAVLVVAIGNNKSHLFTFLL